MKILLVEDDERLSRSLARLLVQDRHNVEVAADGETGLEIALGENGIDVVVLDIGLPDISGIEVARRIRRDKRDLAILMLTARDTVGDRVSGLDSGADDYVVKPFAYDELAARLRALARRTDNAARRAEPKLTAGPISLNEATRTVTVDNAPVDLSPREFSLLESLLRHPGQALSRDQLLDQAWPFGVAVTPNAVDAYIHYLR
ncbi:MAG TPA: response regulator transcription factor, partial [Candidatus Limnocylindrales bacterium]